MKFYFNVRKFSNSTLTTFVLFPLLLLRKPLEFSELYFLK